MDLIGITMGIVTIPMAVLTLVGVVGGLGLVATGDWPTLGTGIAAIAVGIGVAWIIERTIELTAVVATNAARARGRSVGLWIGLVGNFAAMTVVLVWEWRSIDLLWDGSLVHAAWAYLVATAPWTVFAIRAAGDRRTLSAIRAYAAHIALWLMIVLRVLLDLPVPAVLAVMALPAMLPIIIGTLLALADRDALRNVRI